MKKYTQTQILEMINRLDLEDETISNIKNQLTKWEFKEK